MNTIKKYKAIIYDIDGTLLNTTNMNIYPLIQIVKEEKNEILTYEEALKYTAYPGLKTLELLGIENITEVYQRWVKYVNEYEEGATLFDGFHKVLKTYDDANIIQAIVSSKTKKQYEIDMCNKGIDHFFKVCILAEDTELHKPNPDPLNLCLEKLNLQPEEVLYIGDATSDYLACKAANIDFGYATWNGLKNNDIKESNYIFNSPIEILNILSNFKNV